MNALQTSKIVCLLSAALLQAVTTGAQAVTKAAAGTAHSLFLKSDGGLWAVGYNNWGQLGDGSYNKVSPFGTNQPQQIVASNVTAITGGGGEPIPPGPAGPGGHSLFVKSDGSLWAMGDNAYGELGDGGTYFPPFTNRPEQIVASNVTAVAAGYEHSLFLKGDGSLWAMGRNQYGQLGDGTYNATNRPEQIVGGNVTAIAAGYYHSLFLKNDGSLWAMGNNQDGQLGDSSYNNVSPFGTNQPQQIIASGVMAIAAGGDHSLFIKSDGSLWAMGENNVGQLGDGTYNTTNQPEQIVAGNVTAIAAGGAHGLFLKSDGSLWTMGYNSSGQLGDGTYNNTNIPEQIVASGVTAIAAGEYHSLFLKSDGSLWAMGWNQYGQLGDGTYNNTNRPEQIVAGPPGYNHISIQLLSGGDILLSFVGIAGANYALDQSFTLSPANWVPLVTNPAGAGGVLVFTNTPDPTANYFWRIRSVP